MGILILLYIIKQSLAMPLPPPYNYFMNSDYKHRHHHISFMSAFRGLFLAVRSEINMKIIIAASIAAVIAGIVLNLTYYEWLVIVLVIGMVFFAEMVNTSIEAMTDLITTEWKEDAKTAKDVSAGMVLTSSIVALIIGFIIFFNKVFIKS